MPPRRKPEMVEPRLTLRISSSTITIRLEAAHAPRTRDALLATLPAGIDLHCAKIAGNHILWHAPFVVDAEATGDVMQVPPGGFLYWPERQFLELVFDALQAESAAVTLLGRIEGDVGPLRALGTEVLARQGFAPLSATLASDAPMSPGTPPTDSALAPIVAARRAIWAEAPAEIAAMIARDGINLPLGPLVYAEGYARQLHEWLWRMRGVARSGDTTHAARAAADGLALAAARIGGFCGLHASADVLERGAALLRAPGTPVVAALDELILYAGRLAAWLDGRIAWSPMNEIAKQARAAWNTRS
ncbi:MAG: hypothetical protein JNK67_00065 [Alphaproteobacteria bacterium]|nr:hypothetical protein [Alphaproteobacteria bacterium]